MYRELSTKEELQSLRAEHIHIINLIKDVEYMGESEALELNALLTYIAIRCENLKNKL